MNNIASAIRRATLAAARLHRDLGLHAQTIREDGRIDIFDVAARLEVPLIFKPLDGLLGAYLRFPAPGMLVTTKRPLSVQRFTAAHELGHHNLGHKPSLDDEDTLRRMPFASRVNIGIQEVEANAFAAAFLLPRWLVDWHCERQGWNDNALAHPEIVYQLALRAGTSYEATCWTLQRYRILTGSVAREFANIEPKAIKMSQLGDVTPEKYYGDVWVLTERDAGLRIEGSPTDLFVMRLQEHSGSGYLWRVELLDDNGFRIVRDGRENKELKENIGGQTTRRIVAQSLCQQSGEVRLAERRPWQPANSLGMFSIRYDLIGAEPEGWSRAERRYRLEAAA
jgi:Zn-dependent peptidase ImmA (M78 family)